MKPYSKTEIDKIGNAMVFFAEKIDDLSKTKLLKLIYLAEEFFVRKFNIPMFGLEFDIWQAGPVSKEIFIDLSEEKPSIFSNYVRTEKGEVGTNVRPQTHFSDDEFSDDELESLEFIYNKFGSMTATALVNYVHRKNSLWYKIAKEKGLLEIFEGGYSNSSDEKIDFTRILDEKGLEKYIDQIHFKELVRSINC